MSKTSTAVKRKYNEKTYDVVRLSLKKETALRFKEKCDKIGKTRSEVLRAAVEDFLSK